MRCRDDYLVARVGHGHQGRVEQRPWCRWWRRSAPGGIVEPVLALEFGRDGGAQGGRAVDIGVAGVIALDGADCRPA